MAYTQMPGIAAVGQDAPSPGQQFGIKATGGPMVQGPTRSPELIQYQAGHTAQPPKAFLQQLELRSFSVMCPPGLEYMSGIAQLIIERQRTGVGVLNRYDAQSRYAINTSQNETIYNIGEVSHCNWQWWWKTSRSLEMHIYDFQDRYVMRFIRPYRWQSNFRGCFCCCFLQELEVQAPPDNTIGFVFEECSLCRTSFSICDRTGVQVMRVQGPCFTQSCSCCPTVTFQVLTLGNNRIGTVAKEPATHKKKTAVYADMISVSFPHDLDVHAKACLIACAMLIDYMFFEEDCCTCYCSRCCGGSNAKP
ncbi:phospholipid scramblase 2-like [Ornithodoros turicata]|uniref:phospholipid scramblase 2-like n=1 Tax=Ornithodoros turicata TaxID=34597 RepID=UPI0031392B85